MIIAARILYILCICAAIEEFVVQMTLKLRDNIKIDKMDFSFNIFFFLLFTFDLFFTKPSYLYFSVFFLVFSITMLVTSILQAINEIKLKELDEEQKSLDLKTE